MRDVLQTAVVIPVGPGRMTNLMMVYKYLTKQTILPRLVVLVCDGEDVQLPPTSSLTGLPTAIIQAPKHEPGMSQPRNLGVGLISKMREDPKWSGLTHVWFLDSDVIVRRKCLEFYDRAWRDARLAIGDEASRVVMVGPYDWLPPGVREPMPHLRNDPDGVPPPGRWQRFDQHEPGQPVYHDLFAGLACFSGNLIWPIDRFHEVGGFWNDLHHGRCEDGELGVRAVVSGVGIMFVRGARGWHLHHDRNMDWIVRANARDIPMLDGRHPYLKEEGLLVADEDGKRFNYRCKECGEEMNAVLSWGHRENHK